MDEPTGTASQSISIAVPTPVCRNLQIGDKDVQVVDVLGEYWISRSDLAAAMHLSRQSGM
jgi:hypothetical protein